MTQTTLWLFPLLLGSVFGIASSIKAGLRWAWGLFIQHSIVFAVAVTGLWIAPKYDWLCALIGWIFLLGYTVTARMLLIKMSQALGLLRCEEAVKLARIVRVFFWGPPGQYWLDLAYMINFYLRGDAKAANAIYEKWNAVKLPRPIADSLVAYAMIGLLVMRDWDSTIEKYEDAKRRYEADLAAKKKVRFPYQIAVPAVRAFNELGRYAEGLEALKLADLPSSNYGRDTIETLFLSFFALLGSEENLNAVLASMKNSKTALPEHARLYWQARCSNERGAYEEAIQLFGESLRKTPERDSAWRDRTQYQLRICQETLLQDRLQPLETTSAELQSDSETLSSRQEQGCSAEESMRLAELRKSAAADARQIMDRCLSISETMNSRKSPQAVHALTGLISICFALSWPPIAVVMNMGNFAVQCNVWGVLQGKMLMEGQWWRLISYQFLHGGPAHLMMNLFALVWFGRYVENLFGPLRLLIIFFGSGVLSGLLQVLITMNEPAVGASGAVLGVFGAGMAATIRLKNVLPDNIRKHELSWMIAVAVTQLAFDQIVNFLFPVREGAHHDAIRIAAAAHMGGIISGFAIGWLLPIRKLGTEEKSARIQGDSSQVSS